MRRTLLALLVLAGCAGPDSDPVEVAEQFHAMRLAGDDPGLYALLTDADRAAFPLEAFPAGLPSSAMMDVLGWSGARLDSASLLGAQGDTAAVVLRIVNGRSDTLRLIATHDPLRIWLYERDRLRWRVSMGLAERALMDSLAALLRADARTTDSDAVARAEAYLLAAERHPRMARPSDIEAAAALLRRAAVAGSLRIDLQLADTRGVPFLEGRIENPTGRRIATLRLIVRDAEGREEPLEVWGVEPGARAPVRQITDLRNGPLTYRLERIQVF